MKQNSSLLTFFICKYIFRKLINGWKENILFKKMYSMYKWKNEKKKEASVETYDQSAFWCITLKLATSEFL